MYLIPTLHALDLHNLVRFFTDKDMWSALQLRFQRQPTTNIIEDVLWWQGI